MRFTERAKKDLRAIAWMAAFLLFFLLSGAGYLYFNLCSDDAFSTTLSPTGKYKATVTVRNCGATTSYNYMVSIGESGDTYFLEKAGWLYGARRNAKGDWGVSVVWLSENDVSVRYFDGHSLKLENSVPVVAGQLMTVSFDQTLDTPSPSSGNCFRTDVRPSDKPTRLDRSAGAPRTPQNTARTPAPAAG